MHRRVHLEPLPERCRRQLLKPEPTVAPVVQARHARCSGNVLGGATPRIQHYVRARLGAIVQCGAKHAAGCCKLGEGRSRELNRRAALQQLE